MLLEDPFCTPCATGVTMIHTIGLTPLPTLTACPGISTTASTDLIVDAPVTMSLAASGPVSTAPS